jgi:hypothetical protein
MNNRDASWLENEYPTIVKWGHGTTPQPPLRVVLSITGKIRTGNRPELLAYWNQTIKSIKELHNVDLIVTGFTDDEPSYPNWITTTPGPNGTINSKEASWTHDKSRNPYDARPEDQRIREVTDAIPFDCFRSEPGPKILFPDDLEYNRSYQPIYKFLRSLDPIKSYDVVIKARFDCMHTVDSKYDAVKIIKEYYAGNIMQTVNYNPHQGKGRVLFDHLTLKKYESPDFKLSKDVHFNDHIFFLNSKAVQDCRKNIERVLTESYPVRIYNLAWMRAICEPDTTVSGTLFPPRLESHLIRPVGK